MFVFYFGRFRSISLLVTVLATTVFLNACVTLPNRQEVAAPTLKQIEEMAKQGVADDTILGALRVSRGVYRLSGREVLELHQAEVSLTVLDYLLSTPKLYPTQSIPRDRSFGSLERIGSHADSHWAGQKGAGRH